MFAGGGFSTGKLITQTFVSNTSWTTPVGVTSVDMAGYGARGTDANSGTIARYSWTSTIVAIRKSDGGYTTVAGQSGSASGNKPNDYCTPTNYTPDDPTYSSNYTCYYYTDISTTYNNPATTGASSTGISQTFPGSLGNVAQTTTTKTAVAVTPSTAYPLVIPSGGSLAITYNQP